MKVKILLLIATTMLIACNKSGSENTLSETPKPQLTVLVYDISKSTDTYTMLTNAHIEKTYNGIGQNGGGKFYGLHIQTNSSKQDPVTADVSALQQIAIKGNAYQQANRERKNKQLAAAFEAGKDTFITTVADKLMLPKNHNFSDIKNALEMVRKIMENPVYGNYAKSLIIISDMENDFPPKHGIDKMQPVQLDSVVKVFIVRPSDKANISEMIPGVSYTVYVSIDDALNSLFNQTKFQSHEEHFCHATL